MTKPKIIKINKSLIGQSVPHRTSGVTGQFIEDAHAKLGMPVQPGKGPDYPEYDLEMKSKDVDSTSAWTIGNMTREDIINTPYKNSSIKDKLQQHYHVYHKDSVIIDQKVYDFRSDYIQERFEKAYEESRQAIVNGGSGYVRGTTYGYFEEKESDNYQFRISVGAMEKIKNMTNPHFDNLFEPA
jgi:hypothetical protein